MLVTILKNRGSRGARALQRGLTAALQSILPGIRVGTSTFDNVRRTQFDRFIINWGVKSEPHRWAQRNTTWSNTCTSVENCRNKIRTFELLNAAGVPAVQHTTGTARQLAEQWLQGDNKIVVRHTATGHSGAGIEIVRRGTAIPNAPLYTRYFRKDAEYRVHVAFGNVIHIQQKRRRNGEEYAEQLALVRTHANGWVFTSNNLSCDTRGYRDRIGQLAVNAATAVGCGHCAVDILSHHASGQHVVVEINSAPGIEADSTLAAYTGAFVEHIRSIL